MVERTNYIGDNWPLSQSLDPTTLGGGRLANILVDLAGRQCDDKCGIPCSILPFLFPLDLIFHFLSQQHSIDLHPISGIQKYSVSILSGCTREALSLSPAFALSRGPRLGRPLGSFPARHEATPSFVRQIPTQSAGGYLQIWIVQDRKRAHIHIIKNEGKKKRKTD